MIDEFAIDAQRRESIDSQLTSVRIALAEAHESRDGQAALAALDALYALCERIPDAQILHVPGGAASTSFALPSSCKQTTARFTTGCSVCSSRIDRGQVMYWDREMREAICIRCSVQELLGGAR